MSTMNELAIAVNDLADNAHAIGWNHKPGDAIQPYVDRVMEVAAALCPPAPTYAEPKRQWFCPFCGKVIYDTDVNLARDHAHLTAAAPEQSR